MTAKLERANWAQESPPHPFEGMVLTMHRLPLDRLAGPYRFDFQIPADLECWVVVGLLSLALAGDRDPSEPVCEILTNSVKEPTYTLELSSGLYKLKLEQEATRIYLRPAESLRGRKFSFSLFVPDKGEELPRRDLSKKKLEIVCPEGWTYHSWQRIIFRIDGEPCNEFVVNAVNRFHDFPEDDVLRLILSDRRDCAFAISGESASIEDFAEQIADTLGIQSYSVKDANSFEET